MKLVEVIWSARNGRFLMFMHGLSLASLMWFKLQDPLRAVNQNTNGPNGHALPGSTEDELEGEIRDVRKQMKGYEKMIEDWQTVNDVNYLAWSEILAAQVAEMDGKHGSALAHYEKALDHAQAHDFLFEEALGNFLLAGFFLRTGSRRAARAALREAIAVYRAFGAVGVAKHIEEDHSLLLQGPTRNERTADVAIQTEFAGDSPPVQYQPMDGVEQEEHQQSRELISETKGDRIGAWQGSSARPIAGAGLPALDMLDL